VLMVASHRVGEATMSTDPLNIPGIPGSEPEPPHRNARLWVELLVAVVLAVAFGLLGIGFVINAAGAQHHHGASRGGQAVLAVVSLALMILCSRWALSVEHRLRRGQPVAQAFEAKHVTPAPAEAKPVTPARKARVARPGARGRRRYGPVGTSVILGIFVAGAVGFLVGAISSHSQAVRSSYVQHHGTSANAIVDSVVNTEHCSKNGCNYTAAILVTLSPPVDGARTTVVHYPDFSDLFTGEQVTVLVDPKQPGYAELPGATFESSWVWIVLLVFSLFFAALAIPIGLALRRLLVHRREHRLQTAAALPTAAS